MSVDKYKFISPGVFVSEIDNTGRLETPGDVGPAIVGRAEKGPILKPVTVNSYFDFVKTFGAPIPGGDGSDVSRNGNYTSPTYGAYAAQAWLRNNSPVTFVRLGGQSDPTASGTGLAGWKTTQTSPSSNTVDNGGAFGLFVADAPTRSGYLSGTFAVVSTTIPAGGTITLQDNLGNVRTIVSSTFTNSTEFDAGGGTEIAIASAIVSAINQGAIFTASNAAGTSEYVKIEVNTSVSPLNDVPSLYAGPSFKYSGSVGAAAITASLEGTGDLDNNTLGLAAAEYSATTGTLAAVWYIDQEATIGLSGSRCDDGASDVGAGIYFDSIGEKQFKVQVSSSATTPNGILIDTKFDFTDTSDSFIRKSFNTNPILTNDSVVDTTSNSYTKYWLGESYEGAVADTCTGQSQIGVILPLKSGSIFGANFQNDYVDAETGYFFSQDLSVGPSATGSFDVTRMTNLFKLVARNSGDYVARNLKVSISDIRQAPDDTADQPYGSFSVILRRLDDTDNRVEVVEQFNNCNLNPNSPNFIGRKIGDKYISWNEDDKRYVEYGDYDNRSAYIYVDIPEEVKAGETDPRFLPFGVRGPLVFKPFSDTTGSATRDTLVSGNYSNYSNSAVTTFIDGAEATNGLVRFEFPNLRLRVSASEGDPVDQLNSYYGVDVTFNTSRLDKSVRDHLKLFPGEVSNFNASNLTERMFNFTLDDMCFLSASNGARFYAYKEGGRASVASRGGLNYLRGEGSYTTVLDSGVDKFTTVFAGGFDGLNIKESEPLREVNYPDAGITPGVTNSSVFNSLNIAIDSLRDPEVIEFDVAAMPGVVNPGLNTKLVDMCQARGDALGIIDIKGGFVPPYQSVLPAASRKGSVQGVVDTLKTNPIDSSYGAAYYPYVQISDVNNGQAVTVPPSVVAIGALSYSQKSSELWFAPAGFTRGGLSSGRGGLPVIGVKDRLTSRDRDKLYENRINPIAQFPAEGIVIFGQKTLQVQPSALDRINVRRLMIYLKRQISRFAATILFDQNVQTTWNRFTGVVEPFLRGVQAGLGITQFKLVLDETTTTPDLIDRNILYAKIFIRPARAIEYIAIDFILTDSGAAFED